MKRPRHRLAADRRLVADRSGAIALIFALTIVPLILLVALSIDYAFYVQSRAQASLAADSAATHAVRAADAVYTYELANGTATATAVADAETDGSAIGKSWFFAALDTMPKATITGNPTVTLTQNANGSAGFTASVSFAGTYPPFFDSMFNNRIWNINGASQAQSAYSYVEILMLLDDSPSMLIASSAAPPSGVVPWISQLEQLTVCPSAGIASNFAGNGWAEYYQNTAPDPNGAVPTDVTSEAAIAHYTPGTYQGSGYGNSGSGAGYNAGTCATGWTGTGGANNTASPPYSPCAFACHTTTAPLQVPQVNGQGTVTYTTQSAYSDDYYGIARQAGIQLRLDVVHSAASQVVTAMQTNEQAASQFSVGIYEFNSDVVPIWPSPANGLQAGEASTDLAGAATAIQNITPTLTPSAFADTDFPDSINDMISGTSLNGQAYRSNAAGTTSPAPLTAAGANAGATSTNPQKDVFIVTDGMEDSTAAGGSGLGEMTSYNVETGVSTVKPQLCGRLKALGYTVYVLYIDYDPLNNTFYQTDIPGPTPYGAQDYPNLNYTRKYYAESTWYSTSNPPDGNASLQNYSPDEVGLVGCATNAGDFFEASSDSEIGTAMNAMLAAALTSTIQLTQ